VLVHAAAGGGAARFEHREQLARGVARAQGGSVSFTAVGWCAKSS
jgi:hypothetical protein